MRFGLGHLRLTPRDFWRMSFIEYDAAYRGYLEARGVSRPPRMTSRRLAELQALYPDR